MADDDRDELLRILEAQGQQFMQSFSLPSSSTTSKPTTSTTLTQTDNDADSEEEEVWGGIEGSSDESEGDDEEDSGSGKLSS